MLVAMHASRQGAYSIYTQKKNQVMAAISKKDLQKNRFIIHITIAIYMYINEYHGFDFYGCFPTENSLWTFDIGKTLKLD